MTGSPDAAYPLPLTIDEVTAEWLTAALRTRYPQMGVTAMRQVEVIEGTATKLLVELTYDDVGKRAGLPERMWIKGGFAEHREYVGALGVYAGEVRFFNDVAPAYDLHRPGSYFGLAQDDPVQGVVALEDLRARGVEFAGATKPMSPAQAAAGVEALARLHGQTWGADELSRYDLGVVMGPGTDRIWRDWFGALPDYFGAPRGYAAPVALHDPDRLVAAAATYREFAQSGPACVLHGDAHIGNAYIEQDGTVGFVDWQTAAGGRWVHDVNYFLVSALDLPDRRLHERDLLDHYLKALAGYGVSGPSPDEAWDDYRRSSVYGFLCWLCNPDIWQPPVVNTATFARFGAAMLDHDTYAALGA